MNRKEQDKTNLLVLPSRKVGLLLPPLMLKPSSKGISAKVIYFF